MNWPGWSGALSAPFGDPSVGAVGPISDFVAGDQFVGNYLAEWRPTADVHSVAAAIRARESGALATRMLMGCCLALSRQHLNRFGLLEEACYLGADDLELTWRYQELGLRCLVLLNEFVHHAGGKSFGTITSEQRTQSISRSDRGLLEKLKRYYGALPRSHDIWRSDILDPAREEYLALPLSESGNRSPAIP